MNRRRSGLILIAFGVISAIIVGFTVFRLTREATATKVPTVGVVVALQDVPERTVLTPALIAIRQALPDSLPPGVLTNPDQLVNRMTTSRLFAGEMVLASRLVDSNGRSGVAFALDKGKVLVTLPASDIAGIGAVRPGDHVDLLATITPPDRKNQLSGTGQGANAAPVSIADEEVPLRYQTTQTTMQNLILVNLGQMAQTTGEKDANANTAKSAQSNLATFAVDHEDALRLKLLKDSQYVKLELVLRAAGDDEIVNIPAVDLRSILDRYKFKTD